ncbi:hypothetical protein T07_7208 [Trichinella nelsoni]|uniref:Uncharacterized protein n=1 Tax=Trichinella nelsoni TaxID=6336 RepID=A0A0V0RP24_9BILA|nr:hypothetical protein T07_7208 [Trichinella nelsoni]
MTNRKLFFGPLRTLPYTRQVPIPYSNSDLHVQFFIRCAPGLRYAKQPIPLCHYISVEVTSLRLWCSVTVENAVHQPHGHRDRLGIRQ